MYVFFGCSLCSFVFFKGSSGDAQEPVYKENAASFSLRECEPGSNRTGIPVLIPPFLLTPWHFVLEAFFNEDRVEVLQ